MLINTFTGCRVREISLIVFTVALLFVIGRSVQLYHGFCFHLIFCLLYYRDLGYFRVFLGKPGPDFRTALACEQAPNWGIGRGQKPSSHTALHSPGSPIFLFALYPTWEPVHTCTAPTLHRPAKTSTSYLRGSPIVNSLNN